MKILHNEKCIEGSLSIEIRGNGGSGEQPFVRVSEYVSEKALRPSDVTHYTELKVVV